jgi:hypothetical protein
MPRKYPQETRLEAVALSRLAGADVAARQLGIDVRTVREWLGEAGDPPELRAPGDRVHARSSMPPATASDGAARGRPSQPGRDAAVAGIMKRNLDKPRPAEPAASAEEEWGDQQVARLDELYGERADEALDLAIRIGDDGLDAGPIFASAVDLDEWRAASDERRRQRWAEAEHLALIAKAERYLEESNAPA